MSLPIISSYATAQLIKPWFAGTLFSGDVIVIPPGHVNIQPYLFVTDNYGQYNHQWMRQQIPTFINTSPLLDIETGLYKNIDIEALVPYVFNHSQGQSDSAFADITIILGYQALRENIATWRPDLRITVSEIFPAGKYDNLNPAKKSTDNFGEGAYQTSLAANFGKLFHVYKKYLYVYFSIQYNIAAPSHVTGFNTYGGGFGTNGQVRLGNQFFTDIGFEYSLTQHWVPALDILMTFSPATTFKGTLGTNSMGGTAQVGLPSNFNLSFAPQIEYDFTKDIAVNAGLWFSAIGRNSPAFVGGVFYLNIYI